MITKTKIPGWNNYPIYRTDIYSEYRQVLDWMYRNKCDPYVIRTGGYCYAFQVRNNHTWFILKWT